MLPLLNVCLFVKVQSLNRIPNGKVLIYELSVWFVKWHLNVDEIERFELLIYQFFLKMNLTFFLVVDMVINFVFFHFYFLTFCFYLV